MKPVPLRLAMLALAIGLTACDKPSESRPSPQPSSVSAAVSEDCRFDADPVIVKALDGAILYYWEVEDRKLWTESILPADAAYTDFRAQIDALGAIEAHPQQYVPEDQRGMESWRRELHNVERAYSSEAGTVRPVHCLDALLFAYQNARHSQLDHPTEFLASVLRRETGDRAVLRVYFGAGGEMFPPKDVYGFDEVERDVAAGWEYVAMLHNHTVQHAPDGKRLGVPAPGVSDVQLLNSLVERFGLQQAWVTNGFYTVVIPAAELPQYLGPQ